MLRFYFFISLFTLCFVSPAFANDISRIDIFEAVEYVPSIIGSINDKNGKAFTDVAVLIIETDIKMFKYISNKDTIKTKRELGEDFIYFEASEDSNCYLTISHSKYKPLTIRFSDYGITLKKGNVWKIKVERAVPVQKLNLKIHTQPIADKILLDGVNRSQEKEFTVIEGIHILEIFKEGYVSIKDTILVTENSTYFDYFFKLEVRFHTIPKATIIYIDGEEKVINNIHAVTPGKHNVEIKTIGYETIYENFEVSEKMLKKDRVFSYKLKKLSKTKQRFNSNYFGGMRIDYSLNSLTINDYNFGNAYGGAVCLDIPLLVQYLYATSYGGGNIGFQNENSDFNTVSGLYFSVSAGIGVQLNVTKSGNGPYLKGVINYQAITTSISDDDLAITYSASGRGVGGGIQLFLKRETAIRLEVMYNMIEFDEIREYGKARKLIDNVDASGPTISFYFLKRYLLFK